MSEQGEALQTSPSYVSVIKKTDLPIFEQTATALEVFKVSVSNIGDLDNEPIAEDEVVINLETSEDPALFDEVIEEMKKHFSPDDKYLKELLPRTAKTTLMMIRKRREIQGLADEATKRAPKPGEITRAWKRFEKLTGGKDFLKGK